MAMIRKGEAYYGEATILGRPCVVSYEPIRDRTLQKNVTCIYFVGAVRGQSLTVLLRARLLVSIL